MNPEHERPLSISRPKEMAEKGLEIYARKYKAEYEEKYFGKFLTIDLKSEKAYLGDSDGETLGKALLDAPDNLFYTLRIGFRAAHRMSGYGRTEQRNRLYES